MRKKSQETVKTEKQQVESVKDPIVAPKPQPVVVKADAFEVEVPAEVDAVLKLYPQYRECFVSKEGFVYPKWTPKHQRGNAILYRNKYFNQ